MHFHLHFIKDDEMWIEHKYAAIQKNHKHNNINKYDF